MRDSDTHRFCRFQHGIHGPPCYDLVHATNISSAEAAVSLSHKRGTIVAVRLILTTLVFHFVQYPFDLRNIDLLDVVAQPTNVKRNLSVLRSFILYKHRQRLAQQISFIDES